MKVSASLPTGVAALFFDSARRRKNIEAQLVQCLEANHFSEVILPVVDYLEPYQQLLSEGSRQELYRFIDRSGESLALRGDFTPMLARLIAPRLSSLDLPLKLFYRGDVLRYQKQSALQREFFQLGAEILETDGERAERAALEQLVELLALGNNERLVIVLGVAGALDKLILRAKDDADLNVVMVEIGRRERRVARKVGSEILQVLEHGQPDDPQVLGDAVAARLERLQQQCKALSRTFPQIVFQIDLAEFADQPMAPELRHHLGPRAYYDGLIFHAYGGLAGSRIGAGGRYDRLFKKLGADVVAAGFCISVDMLVNLSEATSPSSSVD